jgi:DNA polymerase elongation subunit (family B)
MRRTGWLLDAYIRGGEAVLWLKLDDGSALRLRDGYRPDFYARPMEGEPVEELVSSLSEHPHVVEVGVEEWYLSLDAERREDVLHVHVDGAGFFKRVVEDFRDSGLFRELYNTDFLHVQRYLYGLGLPATSKVEADYDGGCLNRLILLDDSQELRPPPFTALVFSLEPSTKSLYGAIEGATVYDGDQEPSERLEGSEGELLDRLQDLVSSADPDLLVSPEVESDLRRLHRRAAVHGVGLRMGREEVPGSPDYAPCLCRGRVPVDMRLYHEWGVAGMVERTRFTYASPAFAARWAAGRTIDSRQCLEAMRRGVLIPRHGFTVNVSTALETMMMDRGGFIISPEAGLHWNVAELDYESMYPHIILRMDVSYETLGEGRPVMDGGLLGAVIREPLERRLRFKHLKRRLPVDSPEWAWCEQRQRALKGVLVCTYGYSGCFANRWGNVAAFEEINRVARERLLETVDLARRRGFRVVYADTDSVFVKMPGATRRMYEELAEAVSARVGFPIALDNHYRFLVFVRRETDPRLDVAKRYFGALVDGGLHYRGIELRRRDAPSFVKDFQERLMGILFDADSTEEVWRSSLLRAIEYIRETCSRVRRGEVDWRELAVSKRLGRPPGSYGSRLPHVVAAEQLVKGGVDVESGELVSFIYLDAGNRNPWRRVAPTALLDDGWRRYDVEAYVDLVLDAAETLLGVFGVDRDSITQGVRQMTISEVMGSRGV